MSKKKIIGFAHGRNLLYAGRIQKILKTLSKDQSIKIILFDLHDNKSSNSLGQVNISNFKFSFKRTRNKYFSMAHILIYGFVVTLRIIFSKINVLICHDVTLLHAGLILKKIKPKINLIYDCNEIALEAMKEQSKLKLKFYELVLKYTLPICNHILQVDEFRKELLNTQFSSNFKQIIVKNYPNKPDVVYLNHNRHKKTNINLVYLGNIEEDREIKKIIIELKKITLNFKLDIIGYSKKEYLDELTVLIGSDSRFNLFPPIKQALIAKKLSYYDIGLMFYRKNNLNNFYSAPNKIYEYLFSGLAVISYCTPTLENLIRKNQIGECVDEISSEALQSAINTIFDKNYFENINENLLQNFMWENQEDKIIKIVL